MKLTPVSFRNKTIIEVAEKTSELGTATPDSFIPIWEGEKEGIVCPL